MACRWDRSQRLEGAPVAHSRSLSDRRVRSRADGRVEFGDPLLDRYVEFVASRARPNTVLATVSDLRAFFAVIDKPAGRCRPRADVLAFIAEQRRRVATAGWCGCRMASRGCRRARSSGGWRACRVCSSSGVVRRDDGEPGAAWVGDTTHGRGRAGCAVDPHAAHVAQGARPGRGRRVDRARCAGGGTGRWSKRWCWAGCAAAR